MILDNNGHYVPYNTTVDFIVTVNGVDTAPIQAITIDGIARAEIPILESGLIEIRAISGLAQSSVLSLEIPEEQNTPEPTPTETATVVPNTPEPTQTVIVSTPAPVEEPEEIPPDFGLVDWILSMLVIP